nr:uncharacterized protein LOC105859655 [Microcebus murinus]
MDLLRARASSSGDSLLESSTREDPTCWRGHTFFPETVLRVSLATLPVCYSTVWQDEDLFIHSVEAHVGHFQFGAIMNNAAMSILVAVAIRQDFREKEEYMCSQEAPPRPACGPLATVLRGPHLFIHQLSLQIVTEDLRLPGILPCDQMVGRLEDDGHSDRWKPWLPCLHSCLSRALAMHLMWQHLTLVPPPSRAPDGPHDSGIEQQSKLIKWKCATTARNKSLIMMDSWDSNNPQATNIFILIKCFKIE